MFFSFGSGIRHPLFPALHPTPAGEALPINSALYGTLRELVRAGRRGVAVQRAIFITQRELEPLPSAQARDLLWERFGVPAYVLLLDAAERVLAYECEAQSGLHVTARYTGAAGETALCECGRAGLRIGVPACTAECA